MKTKTEYQNKYFLEKIAGGMCSVAMKYPKIVKYDMDGIRLIDYCDEHIMTLETVV